MLTDIIKTWLGGTQNFIAGRSIYKKLGDDDRLKRIFEKGESAVSKKLLIEALTKLLDEPTQPTKPFTPAIDTVADTMPESTDAILQALRNEWMPLYSRMNYLRGQLDAFGDSNEMQHISARQAIAFEVLSIEQECMRIWAKRDY